MSTTLVWQSSNAAFRGSSINPNNSWAAGSVTLSTDDSGTAMFNVSGVQPPNTGSKCITVTYTGNVAAQLELYAASSGSLLPYLNITIDRGTGGSFASCTGFSGSTIWGPATFDTFTATSWATGLGGWNPTGSGQSRTYRVSWSLVDDDDALGTSASLSFTWEARG